MNGIESAFCEYNKTKAKIIKMKIKNRFFFFFATITDEEEEI